MYLRTDARDVHGIELPGDVVELKTDELRRRAADELVDGATQIGRCRRRDRIRQHIILRQSLE